MNNIKFVGLHAHSGVGSPFDGFGYPQEHMEFAYENGSEALALTDHGNMNGFAYQVMHAKKMKAEGKNFKPIFGVEAYFIKDLDEWKTDIEEYRRDKKKARTISNDKSGTNIENEGDSKGKSKSSINRSRHLVLLAMNQEGLSNIFKLISESYTDDYFYRKPRIDYNLLRKYGDGIIAASACLGGVYAGCYWETRDDGHEAIMECMRETTRQMVSIFGDRWYGELQWNNVPEQHELNRYVIEMHKEFGIPLISTADSHYPLPTSWKDRELYKRLGWLGKGKPEWLDMNLPLSVEEMEYELYPKNGNQMWEDYKKYSKMCGVEYDDKLVLDSIQETHRIAFSRVERFDPDSAVRLPDFVVPAGYTADDYLRRIASEGLFSLLKANHPSSFDKKTKHKEDETITEYKDRLDLELKVIADRGFSKYFLTMKAISDKTSEIQLAGPGRGSAAGSLVAYALGITQVDPIKYGLLFSRFMRSDATDYPDIDYDVSEPMSLKEKLIEEWGDNVVVPISNWNTLQLRSLIKDISKFYEIPFMEVNGVTNKMLAEATPIAKKANGIKAGVYTPTFHEVIKYSESLQKFFAKYPQVKDHAQALQGSYRSCSRHAGGVVIGEQLDNFMPLISSKGVRQTPWSEGQNVRQLEPMGFIKFDILGLSTLRMIEDCISRILTRHHGIESPTFQDIKGYYDTHLHPDSIDLHDQEVYENIFHKGQFIGVFQFTESGAQRLVQKVKPRSIIDISAVTSIYRPGPLSAGVDRQFVKAKRRPDRVDYLNDTVREITEETYGFLIFQEQIAMLAHKLGHNLTLDEGNLLRKLLTKKGTGKGNEVKDKIYSKFIEGCRLKRIPETKAIDLWRTFEYFSGYGFNKSHAVSYSIISYQCAWLCNYYKAEWTASFLDREPETRKEKAINLAKQHGFDIKPLNINTSGYRWDLLNAKTLVAPLTTIKGLGDKAIEQIIANRPFNSAEELLFNENVIYSKLNKKAIDALCKAGAMGDLIDDRFTGDKHLWSVICVDKPRSKKKLDEKIELYRPEGSWTESERIENLTNLTGMFPFSLVMSDDVHRLVNRFVMTLGIEDFEVPTITRYEQMMSDMMSSAAWSKGSKLPQEMNFFLAIPRNVTRKKTRTGKPFWVVDVIDLDSKQTRIRCWGVDEDMDDIQINKPYIIREPGWSADWGFSTKGGINNSWVLLKK